MSDLKRDLLLVVGGAFGNAASGSLFDRLKRATVTEPEPTEEELRAGLAVQLGDGWSVLKCGEHCAPSFFTVRQGGSTFAFPTYTALRKDLKRTAEALRWLAGVQEGEAE